MHKRTNDHLAGEHLGFNFIHPEARALANSIVLNNPEGAPLIAVLAERNDVAHTHELVVKGLKRIVSIYE